MNSDIPTLDPALWIRAHLPDPADRVIDLHAEPSREPEQAISILTLRFRVDDIRGQEYVASARLYVPPETFEPTAPSLPVWFNCGYELPHDAALTRAQSGWIVVTPCEPAPNEVFPHSNPLCRGPNTEIVLAHLIRGLPFIDPAAVVYTGGSAGGWSSLLTAAEAFPAAAAVPQVPVVNLAYQGAYFMTNFPALAAEPPAEKPIVAGLMDALMPVVEGCLAAYGDQAAAQAWYEHSPVAHHARITARVAAIFSTADFLVPLTQVGTFPELAQETSDGLVINPAELTSSALARVQLLDVLHESFQLHIIPVPDGAQPMSAIDMTLSAPQTTSLRVWPSALPADKQWLIIVVDEGPSELGLGHWRHAIEPDFEPFVRDAVQSPLDVEQLTAPKLRQLLDRYQGREWLATSFRHLDHPKAERADVEKGLRTYCAQSSSHTQRFTELYNRLPDHQRILPEALINELSQLESVRNGSQAHHATL